jgi:ABC-type transport system substrate-binding protein
LVAAADATWNPGRRLSLYREAEQLLVDEAAWIPLYIPHQLVYMRPQVVNLAATGFGLLPRDGDWARVAVRP